MKRALIFAATAAILLSACEQKEQMAVNGTNEVKFTINGPATRVTTTGTTSSFENSDVIEITSTGLAADIKDATFTVAESGLAGDPVYYGDGEAKFVAHYPASATTAEDGSITMTVAADQSTDDLFHANMFMVAEATGSADENDGLVNLTFAHQLAMVKVVLSGIDDATAVTVNNVVPDVKWTSAALTAGTSAAISVKAWKQESAQEYWALVPAQTVASGKSFITITAGTKTYEYTLGAELTLTEAKVKTVTLSLTAEGEVAATFALEGAGWEEEAEDVIGEVVETIIPPVEIISAEDGNFANVAAITTGATGWKAVTVDGWNAVINGADSGTVTLNETDGCVEFTTASGVDWYKVAVAYKTSANIPAGEYTLAVSAKSDIAGEFRYVIVKNDAEGTVINQNLYRTTSTEYPESPYKNAITLSEDYNGLIVAIAAKTPAGTKYSIKDVTLIENK